MSITAMKQALEALKCVGHTIVADYGSGHYAVERLNKPKIDNAKIALRAAIEAAEKAEPDCWAVLTPNGSKLVSPEEAKGLLKAYPLYTHPQGETK